jgi:hypothetical protein
MENPLLVIAVSALMISRILKIQCGAIAQLNRFKRTLAPASKA